MVAIGRLIGIYSTPDMLIEYPDGVRVQFISLCFEAGVISGTLSLSDETTDFGYFSAAECASLEIFSNHRERIQDAFQNGAQPVIR